MSHYRDMKKDETRQERLQQVWKLWQESYGKGRLAKLTKSEVLRLYSTLCINTFGIFESGTIDQSQQWAVIGTGLYLNASRFNHR